jgi:hypothetical protein
LQAFILNWSHYGTTKTVAESFARENHARGVDTHVADLRRRLPPLDKFDYVFVGAPAHIARVTGKAYRALKCLSNSGWGSKLILIFDTYGPIAQDARRAGKGQKVALPRRCRIDVWWAEALGLSVFPETLRLEVGELKGPLKAGEDAKIGPYVETFIKTLWHTREHQRRRSA